MEEPLFDEYGSLDKHRLLDGFWDVTIRDDKVYAIYNGKKSKERKNIDGNRFPTLILVFDIHTGSLLAFASSYLFYHSRKDTVDFPFLDAGYKIVTCIDFGDSISWI